MTPDAARAQLFDDTLACEERRPATFLANAPGADALHQVCVRAENLLRALAVLEEGRSDEPEERGAQEVTLVRIEAKLDLLAALVTAAIPPRDADPIRPLRWSARGACLAVETPLAAGTPGLFRMQPAEWLPSPLVLPASVLACADDGAGRHAAWLRFGPLPATLEAALERHLFRIHRRAIAEARRPR